MIEITLVYAIVSGGLFCLLLLRRPLYGIIQRACPLLLELRRLPPLPSISQGIKRLVADHLTYPTLLSPGRYFDRWSRGDALLLLAYFAANISCFLVPWSSVHQAGRRAGVLAVVNLLFLCVNPYLSLQADMMGISLQNYRRLHACVGAATFLLSVFHAIAAGSLRSKFIREEPVNLFAIVAMSCLCAQFIPLALRRFTYECALRLHQLLALAIGYALWRHVGATHHLSRLYLCVGAALFLVSCAVLLVSLLYYHGLGLSRARISYDLQTITVRLYLHKPLKIQAGQYINLWVPWASLSSFAQTHPFTVISWSEEPQEYLELFIQPVRGFTRDLMSLSAYGPTTCIALFSGPHGKQSHMHEYENVVMIATGFGIAAQFPHLKKLIHDHHVQRTNVRRIHLIWKIEALDVGIAAQQLLNEALDEDKLYGDRILRISMYSNINGISEVPFGRRATWYQGEIPLREILTTEIAERRKSSSTVVAISAEKALRRELIDLMRELRATNIDLAHLEYQP
ncbi:hypothetical protein BB8028_0002g05700 [Beauveria bassiana]|uniref:ferric-chelate reductase (NADPH) n=1 Tax=Beauveria bassiana TaxID=176275 RepID=A0A2S7Y277_BEABA|nr:hypothetical protein BB8028_0002g05700 [Beauveria bassiana]